MVVTSRADLAGAHRIVVKVGSSSITGDCAPQLDVITEVLARAHGRGANLVLVSSGAIATGVPLLGIDARPTDLATQQAAAAVGQSHLMFRYERSLSSHGIVASQVLLTASDLEDLTHRRNAQRALDRMLDLGVLPIVNENDTVATHEIKFGDNDRLAALVAILTRADALVLLSDIDAVYTRPPQEPGAEPISFIAHDADLEQIEFGPAVQSGWGTGGATTKVAAARLAAQAGIPVLMTAASMAAQALHGEPVGTWFEAFRPVSALTSTGAISTIGAAAKH